MLILILILTGVYYGNIWKTSDSGKSWELLRTFDWGDLINKIHFMDENNGYIVGYDGTIAHTNDGGYSLDWQWYSIDDILFDFHFVDSENGWTVGDNGLILHTTDGGNNWDTQSAGTTERFYSVHFFNDLIGWIVGKEGSIFKTTNGGINWVQQINTAVPLKSIFSVDLNIVYAAGYSGVILKTTDGGDSWENNTSGTLNNLNKIEFVNLNSGWIVGDSGTILFTSDSGNTWISENSGTTENLHSISFVNGSTGWVAGNHSTLLKYEKSTVPVELISFDSKVDGNSITLNWETATETNNSGFIVERKTLKEWESLGFIEGNGTTAEKHSYSFIDDLVNIDANKIYYRLKQTDFDGSFEYSNIVEVSYNSIPSHFALQQNFPNPFNPTTRIKYQVSKLEFVLLKVYDILGNEVAALVNEQKPAGDYEVEFDAEGFASGVYYYRLEAGSFSEVKKMILMK